MDISIHVPAWGTTPLFFHSQHRTINFNPRSRVGNDNAFARVASLPRNFNPRSRVGNDLSTHVSSAILYIFQSTFPRGERRNSFNSSHNATNFNPRSRVGNDVIRCTKFYAQCRISIHVPAWGTTLPDCHSPHCQPFQSTFPRGERRQSKAIIRWLVYFNPRSRVGNDGAANSSFKRR